MKNGWLLFIAVAALLAAPATAPAQAPPRTFAQWDKIEISVTARLAPNLFVLQGSPEYDTTHPDAAGGRVAVLFGPDGILMVDAQDQELGEKVLRTIRTFSNAPIRILVNSHIHPDHTGGNALFGKQGAQIFARSELRDEMLHPPSRPGTTPPAPDPASVPTVTYGFGSARRSRGHHSHGRRSGRFHSGAGLAYRRRHRRALRACQRDLHRRLLSQLRLPLRRSGQRWFYQRHGCRHRPDRNGWPVRRRRSSPATARWSRRPSCCPIAR